MKHTNLEKWADKLENNLFSELPVIVERYWQDHLSATERQILSTYTGGASDDPDAAPPTTYQRAKGYLITKMLAMSSLLSQVQSSSLYFLSRQFDFHKDQRFDQHIRAIILSVRHILSSPSIDPTEFVDIEEILLDRSIGLDVNELPTPVQRLFHDSILGYFRGIGYQTIGRIVGGLMSLTPDQSRDHGEIMKTVMNRSG